ncbi:unnamed protein product [Malus baccata var. baccata]
MESQFHHNSSERRPTFRPKTLPVKWFKEWVPQDVIATGGECSLMKWVKDTSEALDENSKKTKALEPEPEPEPTTEVLFLCSYHSCGKIFIDADALRKHADIHAERQHVCWFEGCGKKFLDSSKMTTHFGIHTVEKNYVCPREGCGKAFSLEIYLRYHMKTHSADNYYKCPYPDCLRRFAYEYKLKNHIVDYHETIDEPVCVPKYAILLPAEKQIRTPEPPYDNASSDRPYACIYDGCSKTYFHEDKLKLHYRKMHPGHVFDVARNDIDEASDQDAYAGKRVNVKSQQNMLRPNWK